MPVSPCVIASRTGSVSPATTAHPALIASIPGLPLISVIVSAQVLNGVLLPVILLFTLKLINDRGVMGAHVNGRVSNVIAWSFTVALIGTSAMLLLSPLLF